MSENAFIEGKVQAYRQSVGEFSNRILEQHLNEHPVVGALVTEMQTRYQTLFDNPTGKTYQTFNMSGRRDLSMLVGQTLERIEQTQPEIANQLVEILFSPLNPRNQGEKVPLALPLHQELGLLYPTLNKASGTFNRKYEEREQARRASATKNEPHKKEVPGDDITEIQRLRLERQADIQSFYSGKMTGETRDKFINELRTNRPLRLATIQQQYIQYEKISPDEGSSADWEKVRLRFYDWGLTSPGSSQIAGIETRGDIVDERHRYPSRIRRILSRIDPSDSVNVPFIIEDSHRVAINESRVNSAESRMSRAGVSFDDEGMNKFTDSFLQTLGGVESQNRALPSYFNEPVIPRSL